jgi:hypothetical protein
MISSVYPIIQETTHTDPDPFRVLEQTRRYSIISLRRGLRLAELLEYARSDITSKSAFDTTETLPLSMITDFISQRAI